VIVPEEARSKGAGSLGNSADRPDVRLVRGEESSEYGKSGSTFGSFLPPVEELYRELDGALARQDGVGWRLRIFGIHTVADDRWVQLSAVAKGVRHDLVLRMALGTRGRDAIALIEGWLAHPLSGSHVIDVT